MNREHTPRRRRPVLALAAASAALAAGGALAIDAVSASAQPVAATQQASENWAGYAVRSQSGASFSSVSGSWTQPAVSSSSSQGYSAFWVGLGGSSQQSQSLEQVGTSADVVNGQTQYYAWYELVPGPETQLNLAVHPGDRMTGKVTVDGTTVTVSLSDATTGQSATKTLQMDSPDTSSAEWIAEAPSTQAGGGYQTLPLADFGKVTFTSASATAGGHTGSITDPSWTAQPIDLSPAGSIGYPGAGGRFTPAGLGGVSSPSGASAAPSGLSSDGSSFSVSYSSGAGAQSTSASTGASGSSGSPSGDGYGYSDPGYGSGGYGGYGGYGYGGDGPYYYGY